MKRIYFSSIEQLVSSGCSREKELVYGTVVFKPACPVVDFGENHWPPKYIKKEVCPLILFVQTWTDAKFGFIGGKVEKSESIVEAMNREFFEESGSEGTFSMDNYQFSSSLFDLRETERLVPCAPIVHIFAKETNDRQYFMSILATFHLASSRSAYLDEIFTITGLPVYFEGPYNPRDISWKNNVWGLPRYIYGHGGGFLTPSLQNDYVVREQFVILLLRLGIISLEQMERVFALGCAVADASYATLPSLNNILSATGALEVARLCH